MDAGAAGSPPADSDDGAGEGAGDATTAAESNGTSSSASRRPSARLPSPASRAIATALSGVRRSESASGPKSDASRFSLRSALSHFVKDS